MRIGVKNFDGSWAGGSALWGLSFIHGYSLMILLGVLASCFTIFYFWKRYKYSWEILQILMIITIPTAIMGSKFYTLLVDGGWESWYRLEGLSIYGALIFSIPAGMVYMWTKRHAVDFRTAISIIMPTILIGQALGRWGNFFNHEVYGDIVSGDSLNWMGVMKQQMFIDHYYRAPIFLYESLISLTGYFIIVWVINRKSLLRPGASAGLYLIWYGIERFILQLFRDPSQASWLDEAKTVSISIIVSILFIIIGLILMVYFQFFTRPFYTKKIVINFGKKQLVFKFPQIPQKMQSKIKKEYEIIKPVKPRRIMFFGKKVKTKKKYFIFFGPEKLNEIKFYIPKNNETKWSKKEINKGKKN